MNAGMVEPCNQMLTSAGVGSLLLGLQEIQHVVAQHLFSSCIGTASKFDPNGEAGTGNSADVGLPYGFQIGPLP